MEDNTAIRTGSASLSIANGNAAVETPSGVEELCKKKHPRQGTVLVVDDDDDQLELIAHLLRGRRFKVITANSAAEGWRVLADHTIDCIVCDVRMPRINGTVFTRRVRTQTRYRDVPIIMIAAANEDLEMEMETLACGADLFCPKRDVIKLLIPQVELLLS